MVVNVINFYHILLQKRFIVLSDITALGDTANQLLLNSID
jgi:hypothetical protein